MEHYIYKNRQKLRCGYTTGSCAAAAAKAAAVMLLCQSSLKKIDLMTPKGILLHLDLHDVQITSSNVTCAVKKDSGDDPDITNGVLVYATVEKQTEPTISLKGGIGVGTVTKAGLEQPIGEAAINRVPRQMIKQELEQIKEDFDYTGGFCVTISIPKGVELAQKTFNPKLGIEGGISVLGTSGIVEPMSEQALIESIYIELNMLAANNTEKTLLITPGNYGEHFVRENTNLNLSRSIKCSNYIGQTLDKAVELGFERILCIGHIGKFIKLAGGIMNTHSNMADCRMELFAAHTAMYCADCRLIHNIMACITTDQVLNLLEERNLTKQVMTSILEKIDMHLAHRVGGQVKIGAILFSNQHGYLGETSQVQEICTHDIQTKEQNE